MAFAGYVLNLRAESENFLLQSLHLKRCFDEILFLMMSSFIMFSLLHLGHKTIKIVISIKTIPLIDLCMAGNIPLWLDDKKLKKQDFVKILSTSELLDELE